MKRIITTAFFSIAMMLYAQAQTVDEIINKYIAAIGGKEKLLALKTMKTTATNLNPQGINVEIITTQKHMVGIRTDRNRSGAKAFTVITPKKGWVAAFGEATPKEMPEEQFKNAKERLDIQGIFFNYKEKGTKIELAGKEKVEGSECFNLKVTNKNGLITNYFFDSKTYRIIKSIRGEISNLFLNYKKNAEGYWFPYTYKQSNGAVQTILKIETNIPVDDKIFQVDEGVF